MRVAMLEAARFFAAGNEPGSEHDALENVRLGGRCDEDYGDRVGRKVGD